MQLHQFLNGLRTLFCIDMREYLSCINTEDREHFGDRELWEKFAKNPHRTFCELPDQDQRRVFAIIEARQQKPPLRDPREPDFR